MKTNLEYFNTNEQNSEFLKINGLFLGYYKNKAKKENIDINYINKIINKFNKEIKKLLSKINHSDIKSITINKNKIFIKLKNKTLILDIDKEENFYIGTQEEQEKLIKETPKLINKANDYLYLMDIIFERNSNEWFKQLDEDDIITKKEINDFIEEGFDVEDLKKYNSDKIDLKLLQKEFNLVFSDIKKIDKSKLSKLQRKKINSLEKNYLEIIMGIGDKYEGAIKILKRSEKDFSSIVEDIINNGTIDENLEYFSWLMTQIDRNYFKARNVEESYEIVFEKFKKQIFNKIKKENAPISVITKFVKMLRGDGYDMDSDLREAGITHILGNDFVNEVIYYGMNKKGGIIDKIRQNKNFNLDDEKIKDKKPSAIINKLKNQLNKNSKFLEKALFNNKIYKDLEQIGDINYNQLSKLQKVKLSVLYRLSEKIEKNPDEYKTIEQISEALGKISEDFINESAEKLESLINGGFDIFSKDFYYGSIGKEFGLTDEENELFKQFKDTNGIGLFDLSDNTKEGMKSLSKIAAIMGVAIFTPALIIPNASMMAQGALGGLVASISSNIIMGKGFNTKKEASIYLSSDIALSTFTGGLSGKFLFDKSFISEYLSKKITNNIRRNIFIQTIDLVIGATTETTRTNLIENHFYKNGIFDEKNK